VPLVDQAQGTNSSAVTAQPHQFHHIIKNTNTRLYDRLISEGSRETHFSQQNSESRPLTSEGIVGVSLNNSKDTSGAALASRVPIMLISKVLPAPQSTVLS